MFIVLISSLFVRPTSLTRDQEGEYEILEAFPNDIRRDGQLRTSTQHVKVDRATYRKAENQRVQHGDILITVKGIIAKVGIVENRFLDENKPTCMTQSFLILRLKDKRISPIVLFEYLSSDIVNLCLKQLGSDSVLESLSTHDLRSFGVPLFSQDEQTKIESSYQKRQEKFEIIFEQLDQIKVG